MNINDAFPSKYIKASDLPEGKISAATMDEISLQDIGQGEQKQKKIVISFVGKDKAFVCNKTNARAIAKLYGEDTDEWSGKSIGLFRTEVQFGADMVESIRVHSKIPKTAPVVAPEPTTEHDDDIPF